MDAPPKTFACSTCGKTFAAPFGLAQHRNAAHAVPKPFPCTQCLKRFASETALQQHSRSHESKTQDEKIENKNSHKAKESSASTTASAPTHPYVGEEMSKKAKKQPSPSQAQMLSEPNSEAKIEYTHAPNSIAAVNTKHTHKEKRDRKKNVNIVNTSSLDASVESLNSSLQSVLVSPASSQSISITDQESSQHAKSLTLAISNSNTSETMPEKGKIVAAKKSAAKSKTNRNKNQSQYYQKEASQSSFASQESNALNKSGEIFVRAHTASSNRSRGRHPGHETHSEPFKKGNGGVNIPVPVLLKPNRPSPDHQLPNQATPTASASAAATPTGRNGALNGKKQENHQKQQAKEINRGRTFFPQHASLETARKLVSQGIAWQGVLRQNPNATSMCFMTIPGMDRDVMVKDEWLNRAFAGDCVIVQMLAPQELKREQRYKEERNNRKHKGQGVAKQTPNNGRAPSSSSTPSLPKTTSPSTNLALSNPETAPVTDQVSYSAPEAVSTPTLELSASASSPNVMDPNMDETTSESENSNDSGDEGAKEYDNVIEELTYDAQMLELSKHANFDVSKLDDGIDLDNRPESVLVKVIHIVEPHHRTVGFVGKLAWSPDLGFQLVPMNLNHPIILVPPPDDIPSIEELQRDWGKIQAAKKKRAPKKIPVKDGILYLTTFSDWEVTSKKPRGTKPTPIGKSGDIKTETEAINSTYMIDTVPHDPSLTAEFSSDFVAHPDEIAKRRDLRKDRIFTIDPPTARDIDDAVSIEKIGDNRYRVGVHIADVSYYVKPGTPLDLLAQKRSTSVYMVNTMYPMLPPILSENLCSLNPQVDRYAFSVIWEMDSQGNEFQECRWIGRTLIRSCVKLSYNDAQKVIEAKERNDMQPAIAHLQSLQPEHTPESIAQDILDLNMIARCMRKRRFDSGALTLGRNRLHFEINKETGLPTAAYPYDIKQSNELIEEYMLLANMSVAQFIYKAFPDSALLRNHPEPKEDMMQSFGVLIKALNIPFDSSNSHGLHESLLHLEDWQLVPIKELVVKAMNPANYICTGKCLIGESQFWHYALNVPFYTHFTSPIRRYPDVVVHRQIQAAIDKLNGTLQIEAEPTESSCHNQDWVAKISDHSNERKRSARMAQEDSIRLFTCMFLKQQPAIDPECVVLAVGPKKITVMSPAFCVRINIDISNPTKFEPNKRVLSILNQSSTQTIHVLTYFSRVSVTFSTTGSLPMKVAGTLTALERGATKTLSIEATAGQVKVDVEESSGSVATVIPVKVSSQSRKRRAKKVENGSQTASESEETGDDVK